MGHRKAGTEDVESVIDPEAGGMWFLKGELDTDELGVTILELGPGQSGKEHDHDHDGQEEVYVCTQGEVEVEFDEESVRLLPNQAVRIDAEDTRQLHNRTGEPASLVLVGAPI